MTSRDPAGLHPMVRELFDRWLAAAIRAGLAPLAYCFQRSLDDQARLYRTNRSLAEIDRAHTLLLERGLVGEAEALFRVGHQPNVPDMLPTNAPPGLSWHNRKRYKGAAGAMAWDWVPAPSGRPQWKDARGYALGGELAEDLGLTWSGRWRGKMRETAHIQFDESGALDKWALARGEYA